MPNPQILHVKVTPPTCPRCNHPMDGHTIRTGGIRGRVIATCKICRGLCTPPVVENQAIEIPIISQEKWK